jgi:uncharacterized protein YbaR (Trm112 family)
VRSRHDFTVISKELLDILRCPACRGELIEDPRANTLTCRSCGRVYDIEGEIPVMVVADEKRKP